MLFSVTVSYHPLRCFLEQPFSLTVMSQLSMVANPPMCCRWPATDAGLPWCLLNALTHNQYFTVPKSIPLLPSATILVNMWSVILSSDMVSPWPTRYPFSKGLCFEVTVSYLTSFIYAIWSGHYYICFPPPWPCLAPFGLQCCVWHSNLVFCMHQEFAIFSWLGLILGILCVVISGFGC